MKPEVQIEYIQYVKEENKRKLNVNPLYCGMIQHNYLHVIYQNDHKILENESKSLLKPFGQHFCHKADSIPI